MVNISELVKKNVILKGIGKGKKFYNEYVFAGSLDSGSYDFSNLFPRFVLTRNLEWNKTLKRPWIDIMYNRQGKTKSRSLMNAGRSSHLVSMWKDLGEIQKIREYIHVIEDIELWRDCLRYYGVNEEILIKRNLRSTWYKNYCSWDIYLPEYHLIIELDSEYHKYEDIDKARDRYFDIKLGIKTERFWDYSVNRSIEELRLDNILEYGKKDSIFIPSQIDYVVSEYMNDHKETIEKINELSDKGYSLDDILRMSIKEYGSLGIHCNDLTTIKEIYNP